MFDLKRCLLSLNKKGSQQLTLSANFWTWLVISSQKQTDYELQTNMPCDLESKTKSSQQQQMIKENLTQKSKLKYRWKYLDDNLIFGEHIKNLCSKLNKFYRLRYILNVEQL